MKFDCKTAMVSGVVGGYFLGRTKKAKLALVLAALFMGRRLGLGPKELIKKGVEKMAEIPQFAELGDQVREDLVMAARTAITSTVNRRIESISDSVHERTENFAEEQKEGLGKKTAEKSGKPSGNGGREADEENGEPAGREAESRRYQSDEKESARRPGSPEKPAKRREMSRGERLSRR